MGDQGPNVFAWAVLLAPLILAGLLNRYPAGALLGAGILCCYGGLAIVVFLPALFAAPAGSALIAGGLSLMGFSALLSYLGRRLDNQSQQMAELPMAIAKALMDELRGNPRPDGPRAER